MSTISKKTIDFLRKLKKNNDREWFKERKDQYLEAQAEAKKLKQEIREAFAQMDRIESDKLYRIYRDVRFSKDKTPYNPSFRMSWSRQKPELRGGYYLAIMPDKAMVGCGFWKPSSPDIKHIRAQIAADPAELTDAISDPSLKKRWGEMKGEKLKTSPRGYTEDHPAIEFLRFKQYLFWKEYTTGQVCKDSFVTEIMKDFTAIRPFFDYMSYILGHDLNGTPLLSKA